MNTKLLSLCLLSLITLSALAQTKHKMGNTLQFSVGYNQHLITKKTTSVTEVISFDNSGEELTNVVTEKTNTGLGSGFNISADYVWQRESGWRNIFGLSYFNQNKIELLQIDSRENPSISDLSDYSDNGGYLTSRLGLGYLWYKPRSISWFVNGNVLIGGGWNTHINTFYKPAGTSDEYEVSYNMDKRSFGNGFLLGYGLQLEIGGYIPIDKKWMLLATIQSSIYFTGYRPWYEEIGIVENGEQVPEINNVDNPDYFRIRSTSYFNDRYHNIGFSLGVNYKL